MNQLSIKMRAKIYGLLVILQEKGNMLREPYSKHLDDGIFELRCKLGSDIVRILYFFFYEGKIVLTNGFVKKRNKTCQSEKENFYREDEKVMRTLNDMLSKQMENKEFCKAYRELQPEFDIIRAIVEARVSRNLTQKELAELTGINQSDISKLENGTRNPSVNLLKRLAEGMEMALKIEFIPKEMISQSKK